MLAHDGSVWRRHHETGASELVAGDLAAFLARVADEWREDLPPDPSP